MTPKDEVLQLTGEDFQRCVNCGRELPLSSFYIKRSAKNYHQSWCKKCQGDRPRTAKKKEWAPEGCIRISIDVHKDIAENVAKTLESIVAQLRK